MPKYVTNKPLRLRVETHNITEMFRPYYDLPEGLQCKKITEGGTAGNFFLAEFPASIFNPKDYTTHDVTHYGIVIDAKDVDEVKDDNNT